MLNYFDGLLMNITQLHPFRNRGQNAVCQSMHYDSLLAAILLDYESWIIHNTKKSRDCFPNIHILSNECVVLPGLNSSKKVCQKLLYFDHFSSQWWTWFVKMNKLYAIFLSYTKYTIYIAPVWHTLNKKQHTRYFLCFVIHNIGPVMP